ncbi:autophagy-related protein 11 [[Candida] jaroonii]|uniref:Autophagy-related protein 11 n=1 Tax=[Candida] jaroonii TaxID=467808 RepID=A0ACA9Y6I4_9ASCO|nr:autophagy-related protein 11 [[Candida] jaroonii]
MNIESMSFLIIYNGHNGDMTKIPKPIRYHSLQDFKTYLLETFPILDDRENIFLLTSFGIKLNFNIINEINEVYVFDKRLFNGNELVDDYMNINKLNYDNLNIELSQLKNQPLLGQTSGIKSLTTDLKLFKVWIKDINNNMIKLNELVGKYLKHINNIFRSLNIIFQFINNFINDIEKSFNHYFNYIKLLNFKTLASSWNKYYNTLKKFPVIKIEEKSFKLVDLLNYQMLQSHSTNIDTKLPLIMNKFNDMDNEIKDINDRKLRIDKQIEQSRNESIRMFKSSPVQTKTDEIKSIIDHISRLLDSDTSIESLHHQCKNQYHEILSHLSELQALVDTTIKFKLKLGNECSTVFNSISKLQMQSVEIKNTLKLLSVDGQSDGQVSYKTINDIKKSEDYLSLTVDLPLIFGFLLIEHRRQFEWYDFYAKGLVHNVTEQLTTIANHEKSYQKLWIKKFGQFVTLLYGNEYFKPIIPNLDITLLNNQTNNMFKLFSGLTIERSDILEFIKCVENFENEEKKISTLLNNNFKDLVKSTNNMKSVTKLITSIGAYTSPNQDLSTSKFNKLIENNDNNEFNENLIKGLKTRIKKLEDLLHQQQFRNLNNWPVKNFTPSPVSTPPPPARRGSSPTKKESVSPPKHSVNGDGSVIVSPTSINPTTLLRKNSGPPLDASVTIDKHLDNIRLRKENKELSDQIILAKQQCDNKDEQLKSKDQELRSKDDEISRLKQQLQALELQNDRKVKDLHDQVLSTTEISREYKLINESKDKKIVELTEDLANKKHEISDLLAIKQDLISNMTSKESEFINQHKQLENELKLKDIRIEEVMEDYENLIEMTTKNSNTNHDLVDDLTTIVIDLFREIKKSVRLNYDFFIEFCLILESIGLLLVKEFNNELNQFEYKVTRVKGLRSKKEDESIIVEKPSSKVIGDIDDLMTWVKDLDIKGLNAGDFQGGLDDKSEYADPLDDIKSLSTNLDDNIIDTYNKIFKSKKFDHWLKVISFKDDLITDKFFLTGIAKRFRDVEGFAKKLTKENKVKIQEVSKLTKSVHNKISMNDFQVGDLVLFLPTRIEDNENDDSQPWAAFNIGAPHYFLNLKDIGKEWIVARISHIEQFKVTEENFKDKSSNPYSLSIGITWYMVDAKPEY